MTDERSSNSAAAVDGHLVRARDHYDRGLECHRQAADEIIAAMELDPDLKLREIGRRMDLHHTTVSRLLDWRKGGADRTTTPFGGDPDRLDRAARQAARERPEVIIEEILKDPKAAQRLVRNLQKGLAALKPKPPAEPPPPPKQFLFFPLRDHIVMDQHVLFVGRSDNTYFKHLLLDHVGVPHGNVYLGKRDVESGVVIVSDPPYGQGEPGVPGDNSADHSVVYKFLKPRGGFVFCAYRPPLFFDAEEGIRKADGVPVHYLAMRTRSAHGQGPGNRLRNVLQGIIYWERKGEKPWIEGRDAASILEVLISTRN